MESIEISLQNQRYVLKGDEEKDHLEEVANLVVRKIQHLQKSRPELSLQKASMLVAFDLASLVIKSGQQSSQRQNEILLKAQQLLEKVETELKEPLPSH